MGDFGSQKDKWVCPNDRELSLRAKIKTGWSVKTGSINSFNKPEQLNDSEQEAIMNVIRRAENLDKTEQERVGRLVERLDNMKKNAMGNGTSQCVLCADEFGLLGASPLLCNDCKKAVCTKCSVDTLSAHKEPLWLCKICAETRETWKKSGAWFYKGLPKYILPGKKPEQQSKYASTPTSVNKSAAEYYTNAPVRSYNAWLQSKGRSSSDKEYTDSSDDEIKGGKLSLARKQTRKFFSDSESSDSPIPTPDALQQVPKLIASVPSSPYVMPDTTCNFPVTREIMDDVPEVVPVSNQQDQNESEIFRSPTKNVAEPAVSHNATSPYWYKPRRENEETENLPQKPYKGHMRQESISSAGRFCNGRTQVYQQQQQSQSFSSNLPQERCPAPEDISYEDVASPEGASKRFKKKWLQKFKKR